MFSNFFPHAQHPSKKLDGIPLYFSLLYMLTTLCLFIPFSSLFLLTFLNEFWNVWKFNCEMWYIWLKNIISDWLRLWIFTIIIIWIIFILPIKFVWVLLEENFLTVKIPKSKAYHLTKQSKGKWFESIEKASVRSDATIRAISVINVRMLYVQVSEKKACSLMRLGTAKKSPIGFVKRKSPLVLKRRK